MDFNIRALIDSIGEIVTGFADGYFKNLGNAQHVIMYVFFGMVYASHLLAYWGIPIPKKTDYLLFLCALLIEAMLFAHHLHGRGMVVVQLSMT